MQENQAETARVEQVKRSQYGHHAATEEFRPGKYLRPQSRQHSVMAQTNLPAVEIVDPNAVWRERWKDSWRWFGLVMQYLIFMFIIFIFGMVMTKGLILIWQAWLSDLGK